MLQRKELEESLKANIQWFENSGIMDPNDGAWGVGERVVLTESNTALKKIYETFPAWVLHGDFSIIEHRRPDCCFETALLFLLAHKVFGAEKYYRTAENILRYLYRRSGMRNTRHEGCPQGAWRWSHEQWHQVIYFDDNAWNCMIPLLIARIAPEFDAEFDLAASSMQLASVMEEAFRHQFPEVEKNDARFIWQGELKSPHWGALACGAFAFAWRESGDEKYRQAIMNYNAWLEAARDSFTTSEHAYIVIGISLAAAFLQDKRLENTARYSADRLVAAQLPSGSIPSEWCREAPVGEHLVDIIYTQNWAVFGLHILYALTHDERYLGAYRKALELLLRIQDKSPETHLYGCWRGMYDLKLKSWGGGNRYEGGADSIYSGWTNAPIATVIAFELEKLSMIYP
ncbi:MAG: hypothetical protein PHV82_01290 [Victivallaceae bacterium]|nr:hypothetical protein [Victivallaceae bacterium]